MKIGGSRTYLKAENNLENLLLKHLYYMCFDAILSFSETGFYMLNLSVISLNYHFDKITISDFLKKYGYEKI